MSELDDLVIEMLADGEGALRERVAALEDECCALRTLAQSRGDYAATWKMMLLQAWDYLYRLERCRVRDHATTDEPNVP